MTPFLLERYFTKYGFSAPYLMGMSDCEPITMGQLLSLTDPECLSLWESLSLGYTECHGLPILREEIALQYEGLDKADILCHAGAEEANYCVFRALLQPGDHVLVVTPCYQSLETIPQAITSNVTPLPLLQDRWKLDFQRLEEVVTPDTKMIVTNFPHNPTGALLTTDQQAHLVSIARSCGAYLLCDEVYRGLEITPGAQIPPIASIYDKGISVDVMTKSFGLGGLRIGWVACQDPTALEAISQYKDYTSICNSAPSEVLALIALRNRKTLIANNCKTISDNLALLDQFLDRHSTQFRWSRPIGGCTGFIELLTGESVDGFASRLLEDAGILVLPASLYSYPYPYFRVGFGRTNFPEVLRRFEEAI